MNEDTNRTAENAESRMNAEETEEKAAAETGNANGEGQPSTAEKQLSEAEEKAARRKKAHKRHMRAFRDLILRTLMLALVVYVLFFHLVGLTVMRNGDMYPRIDMGDMVLYYRLEKHIHAQDVIVFEKPTSALEQQYDEQDIEEGEESESGEDSSDSEIEDGEETTVTGMTETGEEVSITTVTETEEKQVQAEKNGKEEKPWWRKALNWLGFRDPDEPDKSVFICRVVAGPGDKVEISEGERLIVNGNAVVESGIFYPTPEYAGFVEYPLELGEGEYFVLADYRNGGADSRFFGAVREDEILGTVITILRRNNL